jgi:hypothetical protein
MQERSRNRPRYGDERRLSLAFVVAVAAHAVVLGAMSSMKAWRSSHLEADVRPRSIEVGVELDVWEKRADAPQAESGAEPSEATAPAPPIARRSDGDVRARSSLEPNASRAEPLGEPAPPPEGATTAPGPAEAPAPTPPRPIDLGLEGGVTRMALLSSRSERPEQPAPSIGLLSEGLAALDAAHGVSRSGVAVQAGYEAAAQLAPSEGLALFDVRADASGAVVSVALVSTGPDDERWRKVGERMRDLLAARRLRVAPGTRGLLTRVRIERGELAKTKTELGRVLERGPALGQGSLPPRAIADESTHQSLSPGQLTPVWQAYSSEKKARSLRVVVLSERAL